MVLLPVVQDLAVPGGPELDQHKRRCATLAAEHRSAEAEVVEVD